MNKKTIIGVSLDAFQGHIAKWLHECFGDVVALDKPTRNFRFFEESTELVQAGGMTRDEAHQLVDYVFNRPVGELGQEVGGVMVTLTALCHAQRLSLASCAVNEAQRITEPEVMEKIRQKQATKPHRSPLPGGGTTALDGCCHKTVLTRCQGCPYGG